MPSILRPDFGLIFWMVIIFVIVFVLLAKFGFPMITEAIDKRRDYIDSSLKLAQEAEQKLSDMQKEHARMIEETRAEQSKILQKAAEAKDNMLRQARKDAQDQADKILAEAQVKIEAERESAMKDVRSQVAIISVEIAEKVIRRALSTDEAQMDYIHTLLDEMDAQDKQSQN